MRARDRRGECAAGGVRDGCARAVGGRGIVRHWLGLSVAMTAVLGVCVVDVGAQAQTPPGGPMAPPDGRMGPRPAEKDEAFEREARRLEARNELQRVMGDASDRGRVLILTWRSNEFDPMVWETPAIASWVERNGVVFDASPLGSRESFGIVDRKLGGFEMFLRGRRLTNIMASQAEGIKGLPAFGNLNAQSTRVASFASATMTHGALQRGLREALQKDSLFRQAHESRLQEAGFVAGRWQFENIDGQLEPIEDAPAGAGVDFVLSRLALARQAKADKAAKKAGAMLTWIVERAEGCEPSFVAARLLVVMPEMRTLGDFEASVRARATALGGAAYMRLCDLRSRVDARAVVDFEVSARMSRELSDFILTLDRLANFYEDNSTNTFSGDVAVARFASDRLHTGARPDPQGIYRWMKSVARSLDAPGPRQLVGEEQERYIASKRWVFALEACRAHLGLLEADDATLADEVVRFAASALPEPTTELDVKRWAACVALAKGKANERHLTLISESSKRGDADPLLKRLKVELGQELAPAAASGVGRGSAGGTPGPVPRTTSPEQAPRR